MKQTIFTLLLLTTIGFLSCRKTDNHQTITQYDQSQIKSYIANNGITGMKQDTVGGDTSGIYYKIILPGSGTPLQYSDEISYVYTVRSFDGKFVSTDTVQNQFLGFIGHITASNFPVGVEIAIINDLKYSGGSMRILIPSNLAYGVTGYGSGSTTVAGSHVAGNQCLDYYVHIIAKQPDVSSTKQTGYFGTGYFQALYDDQVIKNYMAAHSLTGEYLPDSGVYYKIMTKGTGTDPITDNTTAEVEYNERLLDVNQTVVGGVNPTSDPGTDSTALEIPSIPVAGAVRMLKKYAVKGTVISMIIPSGQAYGLASPSGVPANACLRYEFTIVDVSP